MAKLLVVETSPRGDYSISRGLTRRFVAQWRAAHPGGDVVERDLMATDHLVIATPVYNYNVPAALKAWIDHIVRKGMTLGMDGSGLVTGKKATVLLASGGVYTEGSPIRDRDIATQYLRLILNVIGITDVTFIAAGNAKAVDLGQIGREDFLAKFQGEITAEIIELAAGEAATRERVA